MNERTYKILDDEGVIYHISISINPADKNNQGCFQIRLFDEHMAEIEYAYLDFTDENLSIDNITESQVLDCIDSLEKHIITVEKIDETQVLRFSSTRKEYRKIIKVAYSNEKEMEAGLKSIQKQLESNEQYKNGNISIEYTGNCSYMEINEYEYFVAILIAIECPYDPVISI